MVTRRQAAALKKQATSESNTEPVAGPSRQAPNDEPVAGPSKVAKPSPPSPSARSLSSSSTSSPNPPPEPKKADVKSDHLDLDDLFDNEAVIFQNDKLKIFVVKQEHKRQKKFRIEDHLFVIRVKVFNGKMPLLRDIESLLEKSFQFMINNLKNYYKQDETNLVYLTICQQSFENEIRSGAFELQAHEMETMVNYAMNMFNRFVNSHETMRLDKSFEVYFKILSTEHVNYPKNRRRRRIVIGCRQYNIKKSPAVCSGN